MFNNGDLFSNASKQNEILLSERLGRPGGPFTNMDQL